MATPKSETPILAAREAARAIRHNAKWVLGYEVTEASEEAGPGVVVFGVTEPGTGYRLVVTVHVGE